MAPIDRIQQLIEKGHYLEARAQAADALRQSEHPRLQQLYALSLSKSGAPKAALEYLEPIYRKHSDDAEAAGILGGIYKELFKKSQEPAFAALSRDTYLKNFDSTKNTYTGINAAAMALMAGQASKAKTIAREIIGMIDPATEDFWDSVTLAEAHLLSRNTRAATDQYLKARRTGPQEWGKISSVYNQLWLLNHYLSVPATVLQAFHPPGVAAFVGHMIDRPGRPSPRFPEYIGDQVRDALLAAMRTLNISIGYSSLACGGDIIFCEALASIGGEVNILLGFDLHDYLNESVRYAGQSWVDRFEKLTREHSVSYITRENYQGTRDLFSLQSKVILGASIHRSRLLQTNSHLLTTLSETDAAVKEGGTRDTLRLWPYPQQWVNINPDRFINNQGANPAPVHAPAKTAVVTGDQERRTDREVLCLTMIGLPPDQLAVVEQDIIDMTPGSAIDQGRLKIKTGLVVVGFDSIHDAAALAFAVSGLLLAQQPSFSFRTLLHAGPVVMSDNAGDNISGPQVALMEALLPLTLSNRMYATAPATMLLSLSPERYYAEFAGSYSGNTGDSEVDLFQIQVQ